MRARQNSTTWRSSAVLYHPTASAKSALPELLPRGGSAVTVSATVDLAAGTLSWSVSGTNSNCTVSGSSSGVSAVDPGNLFTTLDWVVSGVGYRGLTGGILFPWLQPHGKIEFSRPSPITHASEDWHGPAFVLATAPSTWAARVSANGKTSQLDTS